ncbi:lipoprotein NlpI [Rheinheimera sp. 4Y26]|uniref:lipoprotein NlpI n=1 Tax=Rheinheimera sp. 4Y26 TaxID=2977811 RepID=UPI0021B13652|nr:lipoprotein NlpI [Rheinheimera sp. 4Y26]MCT6700217.1 lipoprotein NlpI [Rheinheimera sp. 4Y26]
MLKQQTKVNTFRQSRLVLAGLLSLLLGSGIAGCAATAPAPAGVLVEQPLTPEPMVVPYRTEIAIARLNEILQSAELTEPQRARLYYDRGVMYDSVGLAALARFDFMRALRLKPDMADAYNFIGIHHTLNGDFDSAYEAFDSALELEPDYQYVYLNRAIALQYDDKLELALRDFKQFQSIQPSDPYRALWLYLAQVEQSEQAAQAELRAQFVKLDKKQWASQIAAFYLGDISEQQLLNIASSNALEPKQLAEQLCEVYFYLAKWHALQKNPTQAIEYYKKTLATNVYEFVEHRYARLEMARLRQLVVAEGAAAEDAAAEDEEHAH